MKLITRIKNYLNNSEIDDRERLFMLLAGISLSGLIVAFFSGLFMGENFESLLYCAIAFVVFGVITIIGFRIKKVVGISYITAFILIFIFMPLNFFSSGGIHGGAVIWGVFDIMYISLVLRGKARVIFLTLDFLVSIVIFALYKLYPSLTLEHDEDTAFFDSAYSFVIVSAFLIVMVGFQNYLYRVENKKSNEQKDEIDELNKAQNRFFSSMSHEIRTPINTIIGLNEMILREDISEEINEDATNIESASKLLLHLINDILDMSKFQSGQMTINPAAYHLSDMISDVVGMIWIRAREKGLEFIVDVSPNLPAELYGDEMRIKQILINILNNAVKYTEHGSVTFSVHGEEQDGDINVVYSVTDTGMGIRKESIPYLFDAFKRVDEEHTTMIEGTGLGLSIVKQFVDLMGGKISVDSVYTQGSTFSVEIPQQIVGDVKIGQLDKGKKTLGRRSNYHVKFEAPKAKILVVDDTAANLLVVKKLLRDTKVQITAVSSGDEALDMTLETPYDVIFMDHKMPGMDGITCFHRIRTQIGGLCHETKVIALTANAGSDIAALYDREGFDGYLVKPVNSDALEEMLMDNLPERLVTVMSVDNIEEKSRLWREEHKVKAGVEVATISMADLPKDMLDVHGISTIPVEVKTDKGIFRDKVDLSTMDLLEYMGHDEGKARVLPLSQEKYTEAFSEGLGRARNVIFIPMSANITNSSYPTALEAAKSFDNVIVIDPGQLSSGQGMVALEAARLAESGASVEEIVAGVEKKKKLIHTSFIVDDMKYLARAEHVTVHAVELTKAFMVRVVIGMKNGNTHPRGICFGSRDRAWRRYIKSTLRHKDRIDTSLLFITYVGLNREELDKIRDEVEKIVHFDEIRTQEASPAVAIDCGPGTFGLIWAYKE